MGDEPTLTRMELINLKGKIKLAKKGHKLLKQKRDALVIEFFKILRKSKDVRKIVSEKMIEAYKSLAIAKSYFTPFELEEVAMKNKKEIYVDIEVNNIMGVKIPDISVFDETEKKKFFIKSAILKDTIKKYEEVLYLCVDLAKTEIAIKRLIREIEKTKRRVNSLEFILIPRLEHQIKEIILKLEELERDNFVSLKTFKRKAERKGTML